MDRAFWYRFCHNAKCSLAMACFGVLVMMFTGLHMHGVAGHIAYGIGMVVLPILGFSAFFAHCVQSEFAPAPQTQQAQRTP
jgi:hypothetical protein